jgi:hypothetical protein
MYIPTQYCKPTEIHIDAARNTVHQAKQWRKRWKKLSDNTARGGLLEHAAPKKQYTCVNLKVHHQTAPGDELL